MALQPASVFGNNTGMATPIGSLNERQRRLESVRRLIVDLELAIQEPIREFLKLSPGDISQHPETVDDLQASLRLISENMRRGLQTVYDAISGLSEEAMILDELQKRSMQIATNLEQLRRDRIAEKERLSTLRWEAEKERRGL
jgi:hypothetical protein